MTGLDDRMAVWAQRLRRVAYAFGFAGMMMMLVARGSGDPVAQQAWSARSMLCLGFMMASFIAYYVLGMLRMNRR